MFLGIGRNRQYHMWRNKLHLFPDSAKLSFISLRAKRLDGNEVSFVSEGNNFLFLIKINDILYLSYVWNPLFSLFAGTKYTFFINIIHFQPREIYMASCMTNCIPDTFQNYNSLIWETFRLLLHSSLSNVSFNFF